jgi:hypothetical protein
MHLFESSQFCELTALAQTDRFPSEGSMQTVLKSDRLTGFRGLGLSLRGTCTRFKCRPDGTIRMAILNQDS